MGTYGFTATITDAGGLFVTSSVTVTVNPTPSVVISPATVRMDLSWDDASTQQFTAVAQDQSATPGPAAALHVDGQFGHDHDGGPLLCSGHAGQRQDYADERLDSRLGERDRLQPSAHGGDAGQRYPQPVDRENGRAFRFGSGRRRRKQFVLHLVHHHAPTERRAHVQRERHQRREEQQSHLRRGGNL